MIPRELIKNLAFSLVVFVIFGSLTYVVYRTVRTVRIYRYVKSKAGGWDGKVHRYDEVLGYAPIPNSQGAQVFPIGENIPTRYDRDGFRVPVHEDRQLRKRPLVLALGCSFTHGQANLAEQAYPYKLAQFFGGSEINAGYCSTGLTNMLVLAQRLIPAYEPDYVIVQYSPWLVLRSQSAYMPTSNIGKITNPYFFDSPGGQLGIQSPVFRSIILDLPIHQYRLTNKSILDFISFLFNVGLPLFIHDDYNVLQFELKKKMGLFPQPTTQSELVVQHVYSSIKEICGRSHSRMVVVVIGDDFSSVAIPDVFQDLKLEVLNAHEALLSRLKERTKDEYRKLYGHWRGDPPVLVDRHPNDLAHTIIASELFNVLKEQERAINKR